MATATGPTLRPRSQTKLVFFAVFFTVTIFAAYEKNSRILDPTSPIARHPVHALRKDAACNRGLSKNPSLCPQKCECRKSDLKARGAEIRQG